MLRFWRRPAEPVPAEQKVPVVYRWDLDKTYLKTEFESFRELVRIPFEKAEDKIAAPGVAALIRALRAEALNGGVPVRVTFLSASPPQIGREIRKKLELDGIVYDEIVFKDQLQHLMRGKFRHIREHVGFKLNELLRARSSEPEDAVEYLFGDDWESDPFIYSLYADTVAGVVTAEALEDVLTTMRVETSLILSACERALQIAHRDAVRRIFINLERRTPPAALRAFGARLVPTFNYFQTAACLYGEGRLREESVAGIARSLIEDSEYTPRRLANSLADVRRRGHLDPTVVVPLQKALGEKQILPAWHEPWWQRFFTRRRPRTLVPLPKVEIDYRRLAAERSS